MLLKKRSDAAWQELFEQELAETSATDDRVHGIQKEHVAKLENALGGDAADRYRARLQNICRHLLPHFAKADILAAQYQKKYKLASTLIYLLSAFAVVCVSGQYIFHWPHGILILELAAITTILFLIFRGNHVGWHKRWLDYRMLAERLRCGVFTAFVLDGSSEVELKNLQSQWVKKSWVIAHLNTLWLTYPSQGRITGEALPEVKNFIRKAWIEDQRNFHAKKAKREKRKHHLISLAGEIFFGLTFVAAILHFLHIGSQSLADIWTFLAIAFPAMASAFAGLRAHLEFKEMGQKADLMQICLDRLNLQLADAKESEFFNLVRMAENLILEENADWHMALNVHALEASG